MNFDDIIFIDGYSFKGTIHFDNYIHDCMVIPHEHNHIRGIFYVFGWYGPGMQNFFRGPEVSFN